MKNIKEVCMTMILTLAAAGPAFAVDTTKTYSSGILVAVFLAFCALIVVVQLLPTIMLLFGFIKSLFKGGKKRQTSRG